MNYRAGLAVAATALLAAALLYPAPVAAGAILGAAVLHLRHRAMATADDAQLQDARNALDNSRRQYEAAFLTLTSQRERMRVNMEEKLVSQIAALNGQHQHELAIAKADAFEDGVKAVLLNQLGTPTDERPDADADVISIATRRR
ncbi:hypothetical protein GCM10010193_69290 [Kitasatospora atroaurantiaca]|uniref:Uncharacterized protein n=1 Tax=Kitasatospora atroaurantiaca TaxID=285545 RepID=A0A561EN75_9ACTN|nr:hypothetical protein [Kitasatospora atroaurantiaca]TWE17019.1 hypothetical protein FB465_2020 [Kitasatospora atroaurantiaca]